MGSKMVKLPLRVTFLYGCSCNQLFHRPPMPLRPLCDGPRDSFLALHIRHLHRRRGAGFSLRASQETAMKSPATRRIANLIKLRAPCPNAMRSLLRRIRRSAAGCFRYSMYTQAKNSDMSTPNAMSPKVICSTNTCTLSSISDPLAMP